MKRRTLLLGAAATAAVPAVLASGSAFAGTRENFQVSTTEQASNRLLTFDKDAEWNEANVVWSWSPGAGGWYNLSDVRFRNTASFGWVALAAASGGNAGIIDMSGARHQDRDALLWTGEPGGNPHAIERIPDIGAIVTASSAGYLNVYGPTAISNPSTLAKVQTVDLPGAHGVLWDPGLKLLWAIGDKVLRAYEVTGDYRDTRLKATDTSIALEGLGHDLQPDYSDPNKLLITDTYGAYEIDTTSLTKTTLVEARLLKAYVRHTSGEALWVQGEDVEPRPWSSPTVHFDSGDKTLSGGQFYKARIVTTAFE